MDEAGGENDASGECLDDEKYIIFGAEGRDPPAQNGDADADSPTGEDGEDGSNLEALG